jgi:hypothetical protein
MSKVDEINQITALSERLTGPLGGRLSADESSLLIRLLSDPSHAWRFARGMVVQGPKLTLADAIVAVDAFHDLDQPPSFNVLVLALGYAGGYAT